MKKLYIFAFAIVCALPLSTHAALLNIGDQSVSVDAKVNIVAGSSTSSDKIERKRAVSTKASSTVSIEARNIRGWDEGEKAQFLTTVKAYAQLRSGQDLDNFAKGVLLNDEKVHEVKTGSSTIEVTYKLPAKFLGVFGADLKATTDVTFDDKNKIPKEVTVKFPWYRMFFSLDADAREDVIEAAIEASMGEDPGINTGAEFSKKGRTIQLISNLLKEVRVRVEGEVDAE